MLEVRDPELKDFIDSWHKPVDDEMAALRRSDESDGVPLILTETESVLRLLLDMKKPLRILELGTAHGYSALLFAKCCPDAVVTTIDRNPGMTEYAGANFEKFREGTRVARDKFFIRRQKIRFCLHRRREEPLQGVSGQMRDHVHGRCFRGMRQYPSQGLAH